MTPATDVARARRLATAGRERLMAGDVGRARQLLETALADPVARRGPGRAHVLYQLAVVRQLMDDFAASEDLGREALRHAGDDEALTVRLKLLLAGVAFITTRGWAAGARHAADAMRIAGALDDPRLLASAIGVHLTWRYATGHGVDEDLVARAAALETETRGMRTLDLPAFDVMNVAASEGRLDEARTRLHALLERAEHDGDYSSLSFLLGYAALEDFGDGRLAAARERLERAIRIAEATEQRTALVHATTLRARIEARAGAVEAATDAASEAFRLMDATGWRVAEWFLRSDLGLLELARGEPAAALAIVDQTLEPPAEDPTGRRAWALGTAVEALLALGRHDEADRALAAPARHPRPARVEVDLLRARALVRIAHGDIEAAEAAIADAEAAHRRIDDRFELARTMLAAGEIHRRARRRARARSALREAIETFAFLHARAWAERAREELARIDAGHEAGALTPTQRRVADLVIEGFTNRQVADRLFMSPHTVEAHLSAIYRSLDIRSRTQLREALLRTAPSARDQD
jgi:DNA-binding CsgD family transcriptional regulator